MVHLAQPALSLQIKNLEEELGVILFERTSKGVVLTELGQRFLTQAVDILKRLDYACEDVREGAKNPSGTVSIGLSQSVAKLLTVPLVRETLVRWPDIRLQVVEMSTGYIPNSLISGHLDIGVTFHAQSAAGLHFEQLIEEELVLVGSPGKLFTMTNGRPESLLSIPAAQISGYPLVLPAKLHGLRTLVDSVLLGNGVELKVIAEVNAIPELIQLSAAGVGYTILSLAAVREELQSGLLSGARINQPTISRPVYLARATTRPQSAAMSVILDLMASLVHGLVSRGDWPARQAQAYPRPGAKAL